MKKISSGKVRDIYEVDDSNLVIVTTDRISSFDVVLNSLIPQKGVALNLLSNFWFDFTKDIVPNHIVGTSLDSMPSYFSKDPDIYKNRTVLVKKLNMLPYEFIVRGYMFGSMWKAYKSGESFCDASKKYVLAEKLKHPIITPSIKNHEGHDEYVPIEYLYNELGKEKTDKISEVCLSLYERCYEYAIKRGVIIADTKFEFGLDFNNNLVLGDEIFTPDSSRFWDASVYSIGKSPKSYDKQFVRDWLVSNNLDGVIPAPSLPENIVNATAKIYQECVNKIIG